VTEKHSTVAEKDAILRDAFRALDARGFSSPWAKHPTPFTALHAECLEVMAESAFAAELRTYLRTHSIVRRALEMFYTHISMAARARWDEVPEHIRPITARGWFLGRWLPTFLIIDGPIGRFVCSDTSPLYSRLGPNRPILSAARDFLNDRLFKLLRNGFAHWGFDWEVVGRESYVIAYDWERDLPVAKLHQSQADAFHIIAFALVEVLDDVFISQRSGRHISA
jgi:hypothetical protein